MDLCFDLIKKIQNFFVFKKKMQFPTLAEFSNTNNSFIKNLKTKKYNSRIKSLLGIDTIRLNILNRLDNESLFLFINYLSNDLIGSLLQEYVKHLREIFERTDIVFAICEVCYDVGTFLLKYDKKILAEYKKCLNCGLMAHEKCLNRKMIKDDINTKNSKRKIFKGQISFDFIKKYYHFCDECCQKYKPNTETNLSHLLKKIKYEK